MSEWNRMVVTDNDDKKLETRFLFIFIFLESNQKKVMQSFQNRCGGAWETLHCFYLALSIASSKSAWKFLLAT